MEQSIRNEIPGTVKEIISDKVLSEIIVETAVGEMAAVITTRSVVEMGLKVGDRVAALAQGAPMKSDGAMKTDGMMAKPMAVSSAYSRATRTRCIRSRFHPTAAGPSCRCADRP